MEKGLMNMKINMLCSKNLSCYCTQNQGTFFLLLRKNLVHYLYLNAAGIFKGLWIKVWLGTYFCVTVKNNFDDFMPKEWFCL